MRLSGAGAGAEAHLDYTMRGIISGSRSCASSHDFVFLYSKVSGIIDPKKHYLYSTPRLSDEFTATGQQPVSKFQHDCEPPSLTGAYLAYP
jgi:hypothetical protein